MGKREKIDSRKLLKRLWRSGEAALATPENGQGRGTGQAGKCYLKEGKKEKGSILTC